MVKRGDRVNYRHREGSDGVLSATVVRVLSDVRVDLDIDAKRVGDPTHLKLVLCGSGVGNWFDSAGSLSVDSFSDSTSPEPRVVGAIDDVTESDMVFLLRSVGVTEHEGKKLDTSNWSKPDLYAVFESVFKSPALDGES